MKRLLACTGIALALCFTPVLAADDTQPATQPGANADTANKATNLPSGGSDISGGAKEQSSAPVGSGAATSKSTEVPTPLL